VFGPPGPLGPFLISTASVIVVIVFVIVLRHQPSMFLGTMLAGAVCWFIGNAGWWAGATIYRVVFWWIAFVVLTIAGERLELNRVLRPTSLVRSAFLVAAAALLGGVTVLAFVPSSGAALLGVGLIAVAAWLTRNDIARRTVRQRGLTRYMASCLLAGYVWLAVAGVLLLTTGGTSPGTRYDAVLHSIFVGFVVSMIFGHAPIIFPAVIGVPLQYRSGFYFQLVLLHASVLLRVGGDLLDELARLRAWGGVLNATAILVFVVATVSSFGPQPTARRNAVVGKPN
jgi:hypothetical protein